MRLFKHFRGKQLALHVITMNRCALLESLIMACNEFFDVIRVCDGGSTDGTRAMVERLGVEYYLRTWDDQYHEQDNRLLKQCKAGDWVMIMDDDECPSRPLLENLNRLVTFAEKLDFNMISLPCVLVLDNVPECELETFIHEAQSGVREPFRKMWLFRYDRSVKAYGTPHRAVESIQGWKTYHQPYPYFHYKTSWGFIINDCIHAWINPAKQGYTPGQAEEMYVALPRFESSREIEPWLRSGRVGEAFLGFARKYKDSDKPIRNWWRAYEIAVFGRLHDS